MAQSQVLEENVTTNPSGSCNLGDSASQSLDVLAVNQSVDVLCRLRQLTQNAQYWKYSKKINFGRGVEPQPTDGREGHRGMQICGCLWGCSGALEGSDGQIGQGCEAKGSPWASVSH